MNGELVGSYGCTLCQCDHCEGDSLFATHLFHQSKHGVTARRIYPVFVIIGDNGASRQVRARTGLELLSALLSWQGERWALGAKVVWYGPRGEREVLTNLRHGTDADLIEMACAELFGRVLGRLFGHAVSLLDAINFPDPPGIRSPQRRYVCGCGGLCDSGVPCPMGKYVEG